MEDNTAPAAHVASASNGKKYGKVASEGSLPSAPKQDRENGEQPKPALTAHGGEKGDTAEEKDTKHLSSEKNSFGTSKALPSAVEKVETSPNLSSRLPLATPSFSGAVPTRQEMAANEVSPIAKQEIVSPGRTSLKVEVSAGAELPDEAEKCDVALSSCDVALSSPRSLNDARTPPHTVLSPAPYPSYFVKGDGHGATGVLPAGNIPAEDGEAANRLHISFVSMPHDERPDPYSLPSSARGRDDIIEFVVQRPTSGSAAVPYFSPEKNGLTVPAPSEPLLRYASRMDTEKYVSLPARKAVQADNYFQLQQQRLQGELQQQEQLLQGKPWNRYVSASPGVFVLLPQPRLENNKYIEGYHSEGKQFLAYPRCAPISFSPWKGTPRGFLCSEFCPSYSEERPLRDSERGISGDLPSSRYYSESMPFETRWNVQEFEPQLYTDDAALGVMQGRESESPLLYTQAVPRTIEKGIKVVVPDAKHLLCFGHAGDERRFCFGLLQLPPPTLKYDFLIEKKAVCCGMCEDAKYVAICRKCRMRLPTCPYCGKQSAIRHP